MVLLIFVCSQERTVKGSQTVHVKELGFICCNGQQVVHQILSDQLMFNPNEVKSSSKELTSPLSWNQSNTRSILESGISS